MSQKKKQPNIVYIDIFPGFEVSLLKHIKKDARKGEIDFVIIKIYMSGAIPTIGTRHSLIPFIQEVSERIPVFLVRDGQEEQGKVSGVKLSELPAVQAGGILIERAYSKIIDKVIDDLVKFYQSEPNARQVVLAMFNKYRYKGSEYFLEDRIVNRYGSPPK